jgi:riboflavin kinase/FMN adenylyltransferase
MVTRSPLDPAPAGRQFRQASNADGNPMPADAGARLDPLTPHPIDQVPEALRGAVYAIGNFDGVHRGHAVLFATAKAEAKKRGVPAAVLTFEPHPRSVFHPEAPVFRLTPPDAKARLFAALGMDGLVVISFDRQFASHSAENFIESELIGKLGLKAAVVGYDFHFGRARAGSPEFLTEAGARLGFGVTVIGPVSDETAIISSSRIRSHLEAGEVAPANRLLGYRWFVTGHVIPGERRGRELGMPTANIRLGADCRLRHGIYAVRLTRADGAVHDGIASFGTRPTFDDGAPLLEVHLLDFSGDLYGETVKVTFLEWVRPELRFETVEALILEMKEDVTKARQALKSPESGSILDQALDRIGISGRVVAGGGFG